MADKNSCVAYSSWNDMIQVLPNEMAGELVKAVFAYAFDGEEIDSDNPAIAAMITMMTKKIDEDRDKYERKCEKNRMSRLSSTCDERQRTITNDNERQRTITNDNERQRTITNDNERQRTSTNVNERAISAYDTDTEYDTDTDSLKESKREKPARFKKPSYEEIKAYFEERGASEEEATRFLDHYESNGWKVGRNSMKDWKSAARGWISRIGNFKPRGEPAKKFNGIENNSYDFKQLEEDLTG